MMSEFHKGLLVLFLIGNSLCLRWQYVHMARMEAQLEERQ